MKKLFWINIFILTFLLGIGAAATWFVYSNSNFEEVKPPGLLVRQDCGEHINFPALAKKISEIKKGKIDYFPESLFGNDMKAKYSVAGWYGKNLKAMNEKSLLDTSDENAEIYRFLWLRSFHHPIFVRIERNQNEIKLFTKELDGKGGYEPGKVLRSDETLIKQEDFCKFLSILKEANYWQMQTEEKDDLGNDGAQWILEGVKEGRYHIVERWSPRDIDFREACIYLLKLSGIDIDKLGDDLY